MDIRQETQKALNTGLTAAKLARSAGCDSSTLNKWVKGTSKMSEELQGRIKEELLKIKEQWNNILSE